MTKYEDLPRDKAGAIKPLEVEFPVEFGLSSSIKSSGAELESLSLREPTVADLEIAEKQDSGLDRMLRMLSLLADASPDDLRALGTRDYARLQDLVGSFL